LRGNWQLGFAPAPPLSSTFTTDTTAFIGMHGVRTRPWITAEIAVKCADHNPRLIDQTTKSLENALRREGMND
jgi:hypothetical protein